MTAKASQQCSTGFLTTITGTKSAAKYCATTDACIACPVTTNVSIDRVASKMFANEIAFHLM